MLSNANLNFHGCRFSTVRNVFVFLLADLVMSPLIKRLKDHKSLYLLNLNPHRVVQVATEV